MTASDTTSGPKHRGREPWVVDVGRQPAQTGAGFHKDRRTKREHNRLHRQIEEDLAK